MEFKCIITPTTPNPHNDISEDQHLLVLFAFLVLDPFTPSSQKFFFPSSLPRLQKKNTKQRIGVAASCYDFLILTKKFNNNELADDVDGGSNCLLLERENFWNDEFGKWANHWLAHTGEGAAAPSWICNESGRSLIVRTVMMVSSLGRCCTLIGI